MKIKPEHYKHIESAIKPLDAPERRKAYKDAGLSAMRYRWDLTYHARLSSWLSENVYSYANDDHLDTALRNIVKEY